jgi:hypothetical protein
MEDSQNRESTHDRKHSGVGGGLRLCYTRRGPFVVEKSLDGDGDG